MKFKVLGAIWIVAGLVLAVIFNNSIPGIFAGMFLIIIGGLCIFESRQKQ